MEYNIINDILVVEQILDYSEGELANELGVARSTINRIVRGKTKPNYAFLETFYNFAYANIIRRIDLNALKVQFALDNYHKILFHGAKGELVGNISITKSHKYTDLGNGFYLGESFYQAASFIIHNKKSSVYVFDASNINELKTKELDVSLEWMLAICYYRGQFKLDNINDNSLIKKIILDLEKYDIIIAPIVDNNMYEILNRFSEGYITDKQAYYALSASNLGKQYILKTEKACQAIKIVDRLFISNKEREELMNQERKDLLVSIDKVKIAIEKYRHQGKYIEEILKNE